MMHRCSGSSSHSQANRTGQCTCGLFHTTQTNSFTMLFSMPPNTHHKCYDHHETHDQIYPFTSSSSSVDCTLSLGTPSTRLCEDDDKRVRHETRQTSSFCWDILQTKNTNTTTTTPYSSSQTHKTTRGSTATNTNTSNSTNADSLLARRCANCDTTSTPLWRNGPRGPKSLCNACGIRFKKEERRATAANGNEIGSASSSTSSSSNYSSSMEQQQYYESSYNQNSNNTSWAAAQKMPYFTQAAHEFRFVEESSHHDHRDSDSAIPFLSWRLNVTDRPGLVHDFTR